MGFEAHWTLLVCKIEELKYQFPASLPVETKAVSALLTSDKILLKAMGQIQHHFTNTLMRMYVPQTIKQNL